MMFGACEDGIRKPLIINGHHRTNRFADGSAENAFGFLHGANGYRFRFTKAGESSFNAFPCIRSQNHESYVLPGYCFPAGRFAVGELSGPTG